MNERINGLWWKARIGYNNQNCDPEVLEKFAELIIAECTEQVRGEYVPVLEDETMMKDTHWDGYVQCGVDSVVAIREHFYGVEE